MVRTYSVRTRGPGPDAHATHTLRTHATHTCPHTHRVHTLTALHLVCCHRLRPPQPRPPPSHPSSPSSPPFNDRPGHRRPLRRPQRLPKRGTLLHLEPDMHMHMHASNHLFTLTNVRVTGRTLHQPCNLTSPDSHSPACRAPQVFRPPEGRRSAATKRCRGGRCRGRWGGGGGCRSLCAHAGRCRRRGRSACSGHVRRKLRPPPARHRAAARCVATLSRRSWGRLGGPG